MRLHRPTLLISCTTAATALLAVGATAATPERPENCEKPKRIKSSTKYTRCVAEPATAETAYCLPLPTGESSALSAMPAALTIPTDSGNGSIGTALDLRLKNCRDKADTVMGDFALLVDNSASICWNPATGAGSDCAGNRVKLLAKPIADKLFELGGNGVRVGILGYGGRQGEIDEKSTTNDTKYHFNPDFVKYRCFDTTDLTGLDGHKTNKSYITDPNRDDDPWTVPISGGAYTSVCEMLPLSGSAGSTIQNAFMTMAAEHPRGATDMTYFFDGMKTTTLLGNAGADASGANTGWARNAIMITDGLPNIPRRIPKSVCRDSVVLLDSLKDNGGNFYTDTNDHEYCIDRQFKYAAKQANDFLEGSIDFNGAAQSPALPRRFADINLHNILFVNDGLAYSDVDWRHPGTTLYPSDFLIESSARTGNGKVKFHYIYGDDAQHENKINTLVTETLLDHFNTHAVQRVVVTLNGPSTGYRDVTYNAVSPNNYDDEFGIKFTGLEKGNYSATVDTYYSDKKVSKTIAITVGDAAGTETTCSQANANKTVDGSDPDKPREYKEGEDGILPYTKPDDGNQCRVFRNADDGNQLDSGDFIKVKFGSNGLSLRAQADLLRLQGGTGNCGSIAAASGAAASSFLLALLPLLGALFLRRRNH